jgi:uncharacterized CHY-type Zn-finger protein
MTEVRGIDLDSETRCAHWRTALDIIAIKMKCCGVYYACKDCHDALADHPSQVWPQNAWDEPAILCGACKAELPIREYLACENVCPACGAGFNPGCHHHHHYYFEMGPDPGNHSQSDEPICGGDTVRRA